MTVVAFFGTGAMGAPMARNLADAEFDVRAWNRSASRADELAAHGVTVCATPADAAAEADVLVTMLSDGPTTAEVVEGTLRPGLLWAQMGTVGIEWALRLAELAGVAQADFLDAPVIGSTPAADAGELVVFASGADDAIDRAEPVFAVVAKETLRVGEVGAATRLKLVFNYWALGLTALTGEVLALAERLDVGGERFLKLIEGGFADSTYAQLKGKKMLTRDWTPLFKLTLGRKDVALVLDAAVGAGLDLALGKAVLEELDRAIIRGYGDGDTAAVIEAIRPGSA